MIRSAFTKRVVQILGLTAFGILAACTHQPVPKYLDTTLSFQDRAQALVAEMTLEEKVGQMVYESPAIERLGIPAYNWWNECLHGVGRAGIATVYPQAIGMAAMWDKEQMYQVSCSISDEARAKHHFFLSQDKHGIYQGLTFWTPNLNIFRDPRWGRGMETYGEDPYLTGELAIPFIKGLQGDDSTYLKLIATAKHFVVHSGPESDRHRFNVHPADYDFYDTYTPHFRKAVQQGNVYSVMCAYNRLNDRPCCGSTFLDSLLRVRWGFNGYIVSDCWAVTDFYEKSAHNIVATPEEAAAMAVKAGTDLNCGNTYPALVKAVKMGLITEAEIDISVTRLMLARMKLGMFDPDEKVRWAQIPYSVVDSKEHQQLALETARKSMVLLKNQNNTLPFSKDVKKVAVIGPNANNTDLLLGNYNGYPSNPQTPLDGIKAKLPNAEITYAQGCRLASELPYMQIIPESMLFADSTLKEHGLKAQYFNNSDLAGEAIHTRIDKTINFVWWDKAPYSDMTASHFSVRWSGFLVPQVSGIYSIGGEGHPGYKVTINQQLMGKMQSVHNPGLEYDTISLEAGRSYPVSVEYMQDQTEYANIKLTWDVPGQNLLQDALSSAREADVVILCMGLSPKLEGEEMKVKVPGFNGGDREDIQLPASQTELIKAIMSLNKPTALVLLNGSAVAINWEAQHVPAILEAWYPGQAGGTAIADILWGDYNPAGRLPVTFYQSVAQLPPFDDYSMQGRTYRYFKGEPLYAFGYGLSFTSFTYSNLKHKETVLAGENQIVSVDVTNSGMMDGEEVVQLYLTHPTIKGAPIRSLQAFQRIALKKGETQTVTFNIAPEQMALTDANHQQTVSAGTIQMSVGGQQPTPVAINAHAVIAGEFNIDGQKTFP